MTGDSIVALVLDGVVLSARKKRNEELKDADAIRNHCRYSHIDSAFVPRKIKRTRAPQTPVQRAKSKSVKRRCDSKMLAIL